MEASVSLFVRIGKLDPACCLGRPFGPFARFRQVECRGGGGDHRGVVGALNGDLEFGGVRGLRPVVVNGNDLEAIDGQFFGAKVLRLPVVERIGVGAVLIDGDGAVLAFNRADKLALVVHEHVVGDFAVIVMGLHLPGHLSLATAFDQRVLCIGLDDALFAALDDGRGIRAFDVDGKRFCS